MVLSIEDQQITLYMDNGSGVNGVHITSVYAKCSEIERVDLWDSLANMNSQVQDAWCIGGDFNVILEASEKLGGKPYHTSESLDFCQLYGEMWGGRCRLRGLYSHLMQQQEAEKEDMEKEWRIHVKGHPMWIMQQKLKNLSKKLSVWSKDAIGDIFQKVEEWEEIVQRLEDIDVMDNTEESTVYLNKGQAEYVSWMSMQEALLKQKAQIRWFEEEDNNTRYFHNVIKDTRRRLQIHRIQNHNGNWILYSDKIGKAAVKHFSKLFHLPEPTVDDNVVSCIPECIIDEDNLMLSTMPNEGEIKTAIFYMSPTSSAGPDGFNGMFY
ncbi:uncharacterized protein [Solanum tuberosum]|uniref:uncharacterized protein n=1 Tax=Solanum tuberosum TaxID=4113 RepID=UPI000739F96F|nr:PREDICTED: uncharacterized protein LOC107061893 [Solanum tuberosum]